MGRSGIPEPIRHIDAGEIRPLLAVTEPLGEIATAQEAFAKWDFAGNFVLIRWKKSPADIPRLTLLFSGLLKGL